jgi:hypothetical protein
MLVTVVDSGGATHSVVWQGQDQINDFSGSLAAGAVGADPAPQPVAPANALRAGFLFQNTSQDPMLLLEAGDGVSGWLVASGAFFPPIPGYPIPTGEIDVQGLVGVSQLGDTFTYREWQNAPNE